MADAQVTSEAGITDFGDQVIKNVTKIHLKEIVSDDATSVSIDLGSDAGDDFKVDTSKLVVEGNTGRVGIGTATPSSTVEIEGSSGDLILEIDNNVSNSANFQIQNGAGNARVDLVMNDGTANTTITMKGQKVGIGDTSPSYGLDVNGTARVVGAVTLDSTLGCGAVTSTGVVTATGLTIGDAAITEAELEILDGATPSTTELNYVTNVSSAIQTQLDAKGAAAGSGSIVTTGALNSGSITSGFGAINNGASAITTTGTVSSGALAVGGTATLAEAKSLSIGTPLLPTTDHTATGLTAEMLAGGAIGAFEAVCIHTVTGEVVISDADAIGTMPVIGIAPAAFSDTETGTILLQGFIRDDTWNWTIGGLLYASGTGGAMTQTAPSGSGDFVQVVGVALSDDVVYFNPSLTMVEVA